MVNEPFDSEEHLRKFSRGIAHDLNNLLSCVFGSLDILKRKIPANSEIFHLIHNIEHCSRRAADLTKGLLNLGKGIPAARGPVSLIQVLKDIEEIVSMALPENMQLTVTYPENLRRVHGNATELFEIFQNLCINAKEAITGAGIIHIDAKNIVVEGHENEVEPGEYVTVTVSDSGAGIPEDELEKIFQPYYTTKVKENTSGLGLFMVHSLVKNHNAKISVKSKPGKGTEFSIHFPALRDYPTEVSESKAGKKTILLVDDEMMLRDVLGDLFESMDYHVLRAGTGLEAIEVIHNAGSADLMIIDYKMPGMDGLTCIDIIRQALPDIPVILSTGSMDIEETKSLGPYNLSAVMTKPYEFENMLAAVNRLLH